MEFIYKLRLIDRLFVEENWTDEDNRITMEHYNHLVELKNQNKLILAGKTAGLDIETYGIVVFQCDSIEEAKDIMRNDPAVKHGIMVGNLKEYNVALVNTEYKKTG